MKIYKTLTDYKTLNTGEKVHDGFTFYRHNLDGSRITGSKLTFFYRFRSGSVPGIVHYHHGGTTQKHHQQLREYYASKTLRLRLGEWGVDYDTVRVNLLNIDPYNNERRFHRSCQRNWKGQRRTQYRH